MKLVFIIECDFDWKNEMKMEERTIKNIAKIFIYLSNLSIIFIECNRKMNTASSIIPATAIKRYIVDEKTRAPHSAHVFMCYIVVCALDL